MAEIKGEKKKKGMALGEVAALRERIQELESSMGLSSPADGLARIQDDFQKSLIDDYPVYLAAVEPDGRILLMNQALLSVIGRTREEIAGKDYLTSFIPESDYDALSRLFVFIGPEPRVKRVETGLIAADGQPRQVEWHGRAVLAPGSRMKITCCVGVDITERQGRCLELSRSKEYLENILENSPDAIGIVARDGRFVSANRMVEKLFGYSVQELRGKRASEMYADQSELDRMKEALRREGFVRNYEISMKRKDGAVVPFDMSISLLKDKTGSVVGSVAVARSLSEIKQALTALEKANDRLQEEVAQRQLAWEALEKSQAEYRTIFESTRNATIIVEEDTTISLANAEFARLSGYPKEEIEGKKSWTQFFAEEELNVMKEYHRLRRIDSQAAPGNYETRFMDSQGRPRDIFVTIAMIPGTSKSVASLLDITERKQAEMELRRSHEELEQRSYEISLLNEMLNLLQVCTLGEETYRVIGNYVQKLFSSDSGFLYLLKDSRATLEVVFSWGDDQTSEKVFDYDDCWALRQGRIHVVEEPGGVLCRHLNTAPQGGYLCVPMIAQGEIMGLFHLNCSPSDSGDTPETRRRVIHLKQRLAVAITDHIGLALANLTMRETLRTQSIRDPLTGLFNRRFMEESLNRELSRAHRKDQPVAVIMCDLDHFKRFNDTYGHEAGDVLLSEAATQLKMSVRTEDIVCRYGGEEFVVILPGSSTEDAAKRAEYMRGQVKRLRVFHNSRELDTVTVSLGVAGYRENGTTPGALLAAADAALYIAKDGGRDRVVIARTQGKEPSDAPTAEAPSA